MKLLFKTKSLCSIFILIFFLNLSQNINFAESTKYRDLNYKAWNELITKTDLFKNLKARDFLISKNQNDAYEYNAAFFYEKTGIRLAYFFNTSIIYPEFEKCLSSSSCSLPNPKSIAITRLANLNRVKLLNNESANDDWVANNLISEDTKKSSVWATDLIPMNEKSMFAYVAKFSSVSLDAQIESDGFQSFLITKGPNEFSPKFANHCLEKRSTQYASFDNRFVITEWNLPSYLNSSLSSKRLIDYKLTTVGTCL